MDDRGGWWEGERQSENFVLSAQLNDIYMCVCVCVCAYKCVCVQKVEIDFLFIFSFIKKKTFLALPHNNDSLLT